MKKPSVVSFLITLLLAAALCTHGQEFVTDKDGNNVIKGEQYFIQPVKSESNNGGGLVPAATNRLPICPLGITQTLDPYHPGVPVSFEFTHEFEIEFIPLAFAVTIEFKSDISWPVCDEYSKFWKAVYSSSAIVIGGSPIDSNSWFRIKKAGGGAGANTYTLYTGPAGTVGTIPGPRGAAQLVVTKDIAKTLLVKFEKVDDTTTTTTTTSRVEKLGQRMFPFY